MNMKIIVSEQEFPDPAALDRALQLWADLLLEAAAGPIIPAADPTPPATGAGPAKSFSSDRQN